MAELAPIAFWPSDVQRTPYPDWPHKELLMETIDNGRIAIFTVNRPERMNSSDPGMGRRWYDAWTRFAWDDQIWVGIVTGAGERAFSAGQDLKIRDERETTAAAGQAPAEITRDVPNVMPIGPRLGCWKPTLAAINGFAIAGGWSTAQNCTMRIAADHAEMNIAEARWNQGAGFVGWLPRIIGVAYAAEVCMLADRRISAQRAYEIGFVNKVVSKEQLQEEAIDWARNIASHAPRSIRNFNQLISECWNLSQVQASAFSSALEYNLRGMEDGKEGPRAFVEKRKAVFTNR
jgi:enoyl-CoA hydratase/carnithine racemase